MKDKWRIEEVGAGELFIVLPDDQGGWTPICEMSHDGDETRPDAFSQDRIAEGRRLAHDFLLAVEEEK